MFHSRRGFTLVEMLVVLGIIAVLVALLAPAVMAAINNARRTAIAAEISGLDNAVTAYQQKRGDFPPNFRDHAAFIRHVRKCYPKITPLHLAEVERRVWSTPPDYLATNIDFTRVPNMDEGESLVFWLYLVDNDPREPFKAIVFGIGPGATNPLLAAGSPEHIYPFKEDRLITSDDDLMPSYRAIYSKETFYLYLDQRSYDDFLNFTNATTTANSRAFGELRTLGETRPYWSEIRATTGPLPALPASLLPHFKAMNPTSFQIICAGQDGLFGADPPTPGTKFFPGGGGTSGGRGYWPEDNDNMTNFSEGRRLEDHIP